MSPVARKSVARLGQVGYIAKGVALGVMGSLLSYAALTFNRQKAQGLDSAPQTILAQPFGRFLLTAVVARQACHELELPELRAHRWRARCVAGRLADHPPGGTPMYGLLAKELTAILAMFDQWGDTDRSHRELAHRGS